MNPHKYNARAGWYTYDLQHVPAKDMPYADKDDLIHFDSLLEVEYAKQLQLRERSGDIRGWKRSHENWDFNERRSRPYRANSRIKPDFIYWENNGTTVWVEVKGMPRPESLTQIRRAIKYFPERKLLIYTRDGTHTPEQYLKIAGGKDEQTDTY